MRYCGPIKKHTRHFAIDTYLVSITPLYDCTVYGTESRGYCSKFLHDNSWVTYVMIRSRNVSLQLVNFEMLGSDPDTRDCIF